MKRNKKYKPKPIKNPISNLLISTFLYTRLSRLLTELVQKGTAIYSEDGAVIVNDDGSLFLAEEVIQSAMRFLAIYEDNQKIDFGIDYLPFEQLAQQLDIEKVSVETSEACFAQLGRLRQAFNSMNPIVCRKLITEYRLQSEEARKRYEERTSQKLLASTTKNENLAPL